MAETKNERKATMRQFAARPKKNNFIAAAADGDGKTNEGETKAAAEPKPQAKYNALWDEKNKEIPTKKRIQDGIDTLVIGQYFKVKNKDYWQYYQKTSNTASVNLQKSYKETDKKERLEQAKKTTIVKPFKKDGDKDENLKKCKYFKVAKGNEFKYYQKTSAKGTRPTTLAVINETLDDVVLAKTTTKDYMKNDITANSVKKHIQVQDMVAVDKNAIFSVTQLVNTSRIFRKHGSIVKLSWVKSITAYERLSSVLKYHERIDISEFIQIFDDIAVEIDEKSGTLFTPRTQQLHVATLKFQRRIEIGESVIHMNNFKIALYNFLMRKTRKNRGNKLKAIQKKREGLLLLVIACSIGLPTRKFTNAYGFFEIFAAKYTIVNDSNIIRTLLNLNGIYADPQAKEYGNKEYGNRALELWEIYKKEFPHFKSIDDDNDDTKTLYSYPTATELRYLVKRAETVIKNILDGVDLDEDSEESLPKKKKSQGVEDTLTDSDDPDTDDDREGVNESTEEREKRLKEADKKAAAIAGNPSAPQTAAKGGNLFSKKPLNFLMSI